MTSPGRIGAPTAAALLLAGLLLALVLAAAGTSTLGETNALRVAAAVLAGVGLLVASRLDATWMLTGALGLSIFSGHWADMGIPVPLDRLAFAAGVVLLALRLPLDVRAWPPIRLRALHVLLLLSGLWAVISAWSIGTLSTTKTQFELIDSHGLIPWMFLLLSPVAFRTARQRKVLLVGLTLCGAYLGYVAVAEGANLDAIVWPAYIVSPDLLTHLDRARGPFIEAGAMGLALWGCAIAAMALFALDRRLLVRIGCALVVILCSLGVIFTLTRAIWLLAVVSTVVTLVAVRPLRRHLPAFLVGLVLLVVGAFALVPDLNAQVEARNNDDVSVLSRLNSNAAGLRMVEAKPLLGFGFDAFSTRSGPYYRLSPDYPMNGVNDLHQVFLANAVDLGLVGGGLWLAALVAAMALGLAGIRRATGEALVWKAALLTYAVSWFIDANFTPLTYPFPNSLLWVMAGVAALQMGRVTAPREAVPA